MKLIPVMLMILPVICGCISCENREIAVQKSWKSTDLLEHLVMFIQGKDTKGYANRLPAEDDRWINILTGKASSVPVHQEALSRKRVETVKKFELAVADIEKILGGLSDMTLSDIEYIIDESPAIKQSGLFKFDVNVKLLRNQKVAHVLQRGCVLSKRGILLIGQFDRASLLPTVSRFHGDFYCIDRFSLVAGLVIANDLTVIDSSADGPHH